VTFVGLSPKSSKTLLRHRKETGQRSLSDDDLPTSAAALVPYLNSREESPERTHSRHRSHRDRSPDRERERDLSPVSSRNSKPRRRRSSDPSSDRRMVRRRRSRRSPSSDSGSDTGTVEELPNRFDSEGRPLDRPRYSRRAGEWEKRDSRGRSYEKGAWSIEGGGIGEGAEVVERVVKEVADVIEGKSSWLGLIQGVLSGGLLEGPEHRSHQRSQSEHSERDGDYSHEYDREYDGGRRRRERREHEASASRSRYREDEDSDRDGEVQRDREREKEKEREVDESQNTRSRRRRHEDERGDDAQRSFGHRRRLNLNDDDVVWGSGTYDDPNDTTAKQ